MSNQPTFHVGHESISMDTSFEDMVTIIKTQDRNRRHGDQIGVPETCEATEAGITEESADLIESIEEPPDEPSLFGSVPGIGSLPSIGGLSSMGSLVGGLGGGMGASFTAMSVLEASTKIRMNPLQIKKAGIVIKNMQGAGYSDEQINDVCRALFLDQSEEDMKLAWEVFDVGRNGELVAGDFRKALLLMGEDVSEGKVDELFCLADGDGSGKIDFPEFVKLMKGMNPKDGDEKGNPFSTFSSVGAGLGGGLSSVGGGMAATMKSMSVLETSTKVRMNPLQMRKAGVVIQNMQQAEAGYSETQINDVCRALFLDQSEPDMKRAWLVFDLGGMGELDAAEFRMALPLFGEDMPEEQASD